MTTSSRRWRRRASSCAAFDPELVVIFSPDHYNGFFYRTDAAVLHRHRRDRASATTAPTPGRSTCPRTSPPTVRERVLESGVDVAISASMDVDHGTVQPLQKLFGDATSRPGDPDLHQLRRHPARAAAAGAGARRRRRHLPGDAGQAGPGRGIRWPVPRSAGADAGHRTACRAGPDRARRTDDAPSSGRRGRWR